jgi:hypothetical protein
MRVYVSAVENGFFRVISNLNRSENRNIKLRTGRFMKSVEFIHTIHTGLKINGHEMPHWISSRLGSKYIL